MAQQNGIVDVQCKNIVHAFALLYIRKKSTNLWLKKKKKVHIEQTKSIVTFTHFPTITIVVTVPPGTVATSKLKKR